MTRSRRSPGAPQVVALALLLVALALLPRAGNVLGEHDAFLPAFLSAVLLLDVLSGWLLLAQFRAGGRLRTLLFGTAYVWSLASVLPHVLVFPGVLSETGLLGAQPYSAPWLWASWHTGFAALIAVAALPWSRLDRTVAEASRDRLIVGTLTVVVVVAAAWTWAVTADGVALPQIIAKDNYARLLETVGPYVITTTVLAVVATWWHARTAPALERWFLPVAVASCGDVVLTLLAQARYTEGWYGGRVLALTAAAVVLLALVGRMTQLFRQLEQHAARLKVLAATDDLTGLANRRSIVGSAEQLVQESGAAGHPVCVALVDADRFKAINDTHGHEVGDQVLQIVAARLGATLRGGDVVGRYGGEEFLVVLPEATLAGATGVVDRLRSAVGRAPVPTAVGPLDVTVSVGVVEVAPGERLAAAIARADTALYAAKAGGRDRVVSAPVLVA